MEPTSPEDLKTALELAEWKGRVDGRLDAIGHGMGELKTSLDRVESKVNAVKNTQSEQQGGFKVGALVGGFGGSAVLLVFGAFVTRVFS